MNEGMGWRNDWLNGMKEWFLNHWSHLSIKMGWIKNDWMGLMNDWLNGMNENMW